jgi:hypothetical protein
MVPRGWIAPNGINETRMEIRTRWGNILQLIGLDKPQRAEGTPWDWFAIDELADCPEGLLDKHLLPAMGTIGRTPSLDLIGVPDEVGPNQAEYEKYWTLGLLWPSPKALGVCSFHWRSETVLEADKVEFYRRTMDPQIFEQEMGGRFLSSGGKAFPRFDPVTHVSEAMTEYCPRLALDWSLDFGLHGKGVALLGQAFQDHCWIMDEIICPDSSTDVQVMAFREKMAERGYRDFWIRRFGDAAGRNGHSNTGVSDYEIIDSLTRGMKMECLELDVNPFIKDTINAVRCQLMTATGAVRLYIHPRCKILIQQLKTAPWPHKLEEFHCVAALRYYLYRLYGEGIDAGISVGPRSLQGV